MSLSYGSRCIARHLFRDNRSRSESKPPLDYPRLFAELPLEEMCTVCCCVDRITGSKQVLYRKRTVQYNSLSLLCDLSFWRRNNFYSSASVNCECSISALRTSVLLVFMFHRKRFRPKDITNWIIAWLHWGKSLYPVLAYTGCPTSY